MVILKEDIIVLLIVIFQKVNIIFSKSILDNNHVVGDSGGTLGPRLWLEWGQCPLPWLTLSWRLVPRHSTLDCWNHLCYQRDAVLGKLIGYLVDCLLVLGKSSLGLMIPIPLPSGVDSLDINLSLWIMEKG